MLLTYTVTNTWLCWVGGGGAWGMCGGEGEEECTHRCDRETWRRYHSEDQGKDRKMVLMKLKNRKRLLWLDQSGLRQGQVVGCSELMFHYIYIYTHTHTHTHIHTRGVSLARGPKLLSIKNCVIEIMTWKFIYTYRERCKTGPAHNQCWNWSPVTSKHTWKRFSKFWNTFPEVSTLTAWISWRIASLNCSIVRGGVHFCTLFPSTGHKERSRQALDRLPLVS